MNLTCIYLIELKKIESKIEQAKMSKEHLEKENKRFEGLIDQLKKVNYHYLIKKGLGVLWCQIVFEKKCYKPK